MKRFLLFLLFVYSFGFAQSNLVFNEVKTVTLLDGGVTVPEGKVWKVESFSNNGFYKASIIVDGDQFLIPPERVFWVDGGSSVSTGGNSLSSGYTGAISLNVIEFNVVAVSADTSSSSGVTSIDDFNTDGAGTSYGDDYTPGESVTDYDGNIYETVTIGSQTWTTSNLNVSTYRDGTPIPYISDLSEWSNTSIGAYTYIEQNDIGLGKVYNMYAIMGKNDDDPNTPNKELAPEGYHIPSIQEYYDLIDFYGGTNTAQLYLRSESGWRNDVNGNNESGLNIYPTGRISNGGDNCFDICNNPNDKLEMAYFGTKTNDNYDSLFGFYVTQSNTNTYYLYQNAPNTQGFSAGCHLRLVKN